MIEQYLNQTATWQKYTGSVDTRGNKLYYDAVTINVRKRDVDRTRITGHEQVGDYSTVYRTKAEVAKGDLLDGEEIVETSQYVNYAGVEIGRIAYT